MKKNLVNDIIKKTAVGSIVFSTAFYGAFHFSEEISNAQQASHNIKVVCTPEKKEVEKDEEVIWTTRVQNATTTIAYSWKGVNIKNQNSPRTTAKYPSLGVKKATSIIITNGIRVEAECAPVEVKKSDEIDPNQIKDQLENIMQLFQNNESGGIPSGGGGGGGGNTPGGGGSSGGGNTGGSSGSNRSPEQSRAQARQEMVQKEAEQKATLQQEMQQCEQTGGTDADQKASNTVKKDLTEKAEELEQQMVPTNPVPIVDPIKNIQENIAKLTAKEIGLEDTTEPPLDAVVACQSDAQIKKMIDNVTTIIAKGGPDGEEIFVKDYNKLFSNVRTTIIKTYVEALPNADSCNEQVFANIAEALVEEERNRLVVEGNSNESCTIQSNEKKDSLSELLTNSQPDKSSTSLAANARLELTGLVISELEREKLEKQISLGFYDRKDEDGKIIEPAQLYMPQYMSHLNSALNKFLEIDEATEEGRLLREYLNKASQTNPSSPTSPMNQPFPEDSNFMMT